jgi:acyl carrier protein
MTFEDRIRKFIVDELAWSGDPAQLTDGYALIDNGVLDSFGIFQIVTYLEEDEGIEVDDEDLVPENFTSIHAISSMVGAKSTS